MGEVALSTASGSGFFAPVDTSLIGALLTTHKRIEASIGAVDSFMRSDDCRSALGFYLAACREDQGRIGLKVDGLMQKDKALAALHADYWDKALRLTDVLECMPQKRRDEWYELIRSHATPPFEDEAVYLTLQDMLNSRERFLAERVEGIFRALSGEHVTNSPAAFGKRMIIYVMTSYGTTNYTNEGHITDLRKIIARFMGRDEPSGFGVTTRVIQAAMAQTGEWLAIDGGAMRIRCYKKGTAHLEIHPDMAWRLNAILALLYPSAIPAEFRTAPKRKARDIELIQKPIPFTVISALCEASEYAPLVEDARYRRVRNPVRNSLVLKHSLDKFTARQAGEVLEAIGGVRQKLGYYQFDYDPKRVLNEVIASGCVPDHKSHQYYPTPEKLARLAVELAEIQGWHRCLEPSAGQGGLADLMPSDLLTCVEVSGLHCEILKTKGYTVIQSDFLKLETNPQYDRVVMNPPFSSGRWQAHIEHAASLLVEGGRLVAILPASARNSDVLPSLQKTWSAVFENEFAGTGVSVVVLVADAV